MEVEAMKRAGRSRLLLAGAAVVMAVAVGVAAAEEPDFAAALREAQEATHVEPLKSYVEGPFNRAIYARFAGWINHCTQQAGQSFKDFDLLITVGASGAVEALRYEPKSAQNDCFAALLRAEALPLPPKGPIVVPAGIRMNAK
jgi:hypothetical protein